MDLHKILTEIKSYKNINREAVLAKYIQERLNNSLVSYYKELDKSLQYAAARGNSKRAEMKVLKKINNGKE